MALTPTRWPDASLGCSETDKEYLQVETAGYVIELEHDGKQFAYHASTDRVVLCEKPQ